jgi:hypothetical protein
MYHKFDVTENLFLHSTLFNGSKHSLRVIAFKKTRVRSTRFRLKSTRSRRCDCCSVAGDRPAENRACGQSSLCDQTAGELEIHLSMGEHLQIELAIHSQWP